MPELGCLELGCWSTDVGEIRQIVVLFCRGYVFLNLFFILTKLLCF